MGRLLQKLARLMRSAPEPRFVLPEPSRDTPEAKAARASRELQLRNIVSRIGLPETETRWDRPPQGKGHGGDPEYRAQPQKLWTVAPFEVPPDLEMTFLYGGDPMPRSIKLKRLREGYLDYYLKSYCYRRDDYRTFSLSSVGPILTADGGLFENGASWLNSLPRTDGEDGG